MICTDKLKKTQETNVGTKMGSTAGNDQNTLCMIFMQMFGIKCKKMCNGFRNSLITCNARKALWMALYARRFKDRNSKNMQLKHGRKLQSKTQ